MNRRVAWKVLKYVLTYRSSKEARLRRASPYRGSTVRAMMRKTRGEFA